MEEAGACSIAVAPDAPDDVILAVSGPVEPGLGGVYRSADGGGHWVWASDGLPAGEPAFRRWIYDMGGSELAQGPGGSAVAISMGLRRVFRRPSAGGSWEEVECGLPPEGLPVSVAADAAGNFWMAVFRAGVWRGAGGGSSWTRVLEGNAASVTVDGDRVAVGLEDGVTVSEDAGKTWRALGGGMPNRHRPVVALHGDRVLAGTHGNGVFWTPLSPAGGV
jgi:hypothetical protein